MKKLLALSAVFITVALLFTSCQNPSGGSDDEDKMPGTWSSYSSVAFRDPTTKLWKRNGNVFTFECQNPEELTQIEQNTYRSFWCSPIEKLCSGFKATVIKDSGFYPYADYGFVVNYSENAEGDPSFYSLELREDYFLINQILDGNRTILTQYESNGNTYAYKKSSSIKKEPAENEVSIYTNKKGTIIFNINGDNIFTIEKPILKKGSCMPLGNISYENRINNVPVKVTFKFEEFQNVEDYK